MHRIPDTVFRHSLRYDWVQLDDPKLIPAEILIRVYECGLCLFNRLARPLVYSSADYLRNVHQAVHQETADPHSLTLRPVTGPFFCIFHVLSRGDASRMKVVVGVAREETRLASSCGGRHGDIVLLTHLSLVL